MSGAMAAAAMGAFFSQMRSFECARMGLSGRQGSATLRLPRGAWHHGGVGVPVAPRMTPKFHSLLAFAMCGRGS